MKKQVKDKQSEIEAYNKLVSYQRRNLKQKSVVGSEFDENNDYAVGRKDKKPKLVEGPNSQRLKSARTIKMDKTKPVDLKASVQSFKTSNGLKTPGATLTAE